jgi:hypothetical protein
MGGWPNLLKGRSPGKLLRDLLWEKGLGPGDRGEVIMVYLTSAPLGLSESCNINLIRDSEQGLRNTLVTCGNRD